MALILAVGEFMQISARFWKKVSFWIVIDLSSDGRQHRDYVENHLYEFKAIYVDNSVET